MADKASTTTLIAFLHARLDEDEQVAHAAAPGPWEYQDIESVGGGRICDPEVAIANVDWDTEPVNPRIRRFRAAEQADATGEHIVRHDPQTVLADIAGRRAIVDWSERQLAEFGSVVDPGVRVVLSGLAVRYSGHPDHSSAWSPLPA